MSSTFEVVTSRFVGSTESGFRLERYRNYEKFKTKDAAVKHGLKMCDSDDFNVAELNGEVLVRFWWMDEHKQFDEDLPEIAKACGWVPV